MGGRRAALLLLLAAAAQAEEEPAYAAALADRAVYPLQVDAADVCAHTQYSLTECLAGHLLWGTCESQRNPILQEDDPGACDYVCGYCRQPCDRDHILHANHLERLIVGTDWSYDCEFCAEGKFDHDGTPFTACDRCDPGTYKAQGGAGCLPCEAPHADVDLDAGTPCELCPSGHYRASAMLCEACPGGEYIASPADSACSLCPPGTYSAGAAERCTSCAAGDADLDGDPSTSCQACQPGKHSLAEATECSPCEAFSDRALVDHDGNYLTPKLCLPLPPEPEPEPEPEPAASVQAEADVDATPDAGPQPTPEPEPEQAPEGHQTAESGPEPEPDTPVLAVNTTVSFEPGQHESEAGEEGWDESWASGSGSWEDAPLAPAPARIEAVVVVTTAGAALLLGIAAALLRRCVRRRRRLSLVYALKGKQKSPAKEKNAPKDNATPKDDEPETPSKWGGARLAMHVPSAERFCEDPKDLLPEWMSPPGDEPDSPTSPSSPVSPLSGTFVSPYGESRRQKRMRLQAEQEAAEQAEAELRKLRQGRHMAITLYGPRAAKMWTP